MAACALYACNRLFGSQIPGPFFHGYFDDLLLIPAALPALLWVQRKLGLRPDDGPPRWQEIALHLFAWGVMAEFVAPHVFASATGDWRDLVAYSVGAVAAGAWWRINAAPA